MENLFKGLFDTGLTTVISVGDFLLCLIVSLAIGLFLAGTCAFRGQASKSFLITLGILPAVVCVVIMMVNGNIGAGVAVAGAFSLVRFRSAPGTAREIGTIFLAMGAGLIAGMGYLAYAVLFSVIMGLILMALRLLTGDGARQRMLLIVIPEDLNYSDIFDDLFNKYTAEHRLTSVKTSNMGSLYKLHYAIRMKDEKQEKAFIDELRCRNGNLEISIYEREDTINEL
ncbi:MAG: DUF4956 domain-containing protein [Clostridia bacterium]|nr:DUF4956 domain-containing protein [Clostridia bacterium]